MEFSPRHQERQRGCRTGFYLWLGISMEQSVPQGALDLEDQFFDVDPQQEWTFAVDSGQFCLAPLQW